MPNPQRLIGPKGTVLIDYKRATLISWSCTALTGWGKPQSYWLKFQEFLYKGDGNTVQAGSSGQAFPYCVACMKVPYLEKAARRSF